MFTRRDHLLVLSEVMRPIPNWAAIIESDWPAAYSSPWRARRERLVAGAQLGIVGLGVAQHELLARVDLEPRCVVHQFGERLVVGQLGSARGGGVALGRRVVLVGVHPHGQLVVRFHQVRLGALREQLVVELAAEKLQPQHALVDQLILDAGVGHHGAAHLVIALLGSVADHALDGRPTQASVLSWINC
jgi:hypothetical protein